MVFDTHTHAWGAPSPEHPWTNGPLVEEFASHFSTDIVYTADELLADMDDAGVDEAVVVGYPITDWTDNWYTVKAAEENDRLTGIAMVDQFSDGAADTLREVMSLEGMPGFRLGAVYPYDEMWERFDYDETWLRDAINETGFWEPPSRRTRSSRSCRTRASWTRRSNSSRRIPSCGTPLTISPTQTRATTPRRVSRGSNHSPSTTTSP